MTPQPEHRLWRVTITGAGDSTPIAQLYELSHEFPFVEWGILVSKTRTGSPEHPRYPSRGWIDMLAVSGDPGRLNLSTHICGSWVNDVLSRSSGWVAEIPVCAATSQRIQVNTNGQQRCTSSQCYHIMRRSYPDTRFIFQLGGFPGNNAIPRVARFCSNLRVAGLFDRSGGLGTTPATWPAPFDEPYPFGYAGGLGPDNVAEQIERIHQVCPRPFWIDMESGVRTADDSGLDMAKVRSVLEQCAPLINAAVMEP